MLYKHNPVEFRRLYRKDSATAVTPLVPSLNPEDYAYSHPALNGGAESSVKEALDALLLASIPKFASYTVSSTGTTNETFIVPAGVQEVLVLLIGPGRNGDRHTSSTYADTFAAPGGLAFSFYASVQPEQSIPILIRGSNSPSGSALAKFGDYANSSAPVQDEYMIFKAYAGKGSRSGTSQYANNYGGGGFYVEHNLEKNAAERSEWLKIALHKGAPETGPTDGSLTAPGTGWPYSCDHSTPIGRDGGWYGGGGASLFGNSSVAGFGGAARIIVFWGNDIRPDGYATPAVTLSV